MRVHFNINELPVFTNAVITIGTFDGVHTGHMQVIRQLKEEAHSISGETVIITFHPHPRKIVSANNIFILNTLEEKIELLEAKGIDHLVVVPFDEIFSRQTPETYIEKFLFEKFHPHIVIIGYDHKFGKSRKGDYHLLEEYGKKLGFAVKEIDEHILHKIIVSSTKIREALLAADLATANEYLGYDYFFEGKVVDGHKLGRTLGYPTANLEVENAEKLVPGDGIYAVESSIVTRQSLIINKGMMSIGLRPTIGVSKRVIEVNIFDFSEDIYGKTLRVYLKRYLRNEVKFRNLDELKIQMAKDKTESLRVLK
jgi:riboflavin kinase / FMN adenylyltransferase